MTPFFYCIFLMFISWMLIMPSFKKSLIVEQFQGNYLKWYKAFGKKKARSYKKNNETSFLVCKRSSKKGSVRTRANILFAKVITLTFIDSILQLWFWPHYKISLSITKPLWRPHPSSEQTKYSCYKISNILCELILKQYID